MMEIPQMNQKRKINVGRIERIVSMVGGGAAMLFALRRLTRSTAPLAAGGSYLLYRGISGRDPIYKALGITRAGVDGSGGIEVSRTITIAKPRSEVYSYWRNFENLPRFMQHLKSVSLNRNSTGREQSHWVAKAPLGTSIEWDAELFDDQPDRRIAWRSLPGSQVETHGFVEFHDSPDQVGTVVRVNLVYLPPAGSFGAAVAKLFGEEPAWQVQDDLRRLKQLLETGEIPTIVGQSSGRVGAVMKERQSIPPVSQEIRR